MSGVSVLKDKLGANKFKKGAGFTNSSSSTSSNISVKYIHSHSEIEDSVASICNSFQSIANDTDPADLNSSLVDSKFIVADTDTGRSTSFSLKLSPDQSRLLSLSCKNDEFMSVSKNDKFGSMKSLECIQELTVLIFVPELLVKNIKNTRAFLEKQIIKNIKVDDCNEKLLLICF